MTIRRSLVTVAAAGCIAAALSTFAVFAQEEKLDKPRHTADEIAKAKPSATFDLTADQVRLLVGGASGKGTLYYQGKSYPFTIKAVTAGGIGVTGAERLVAACRREPVDATPVWFMRQSGGSLPSYLALRQRHSVIEIARTPQLCAEVTVAAADTLRRLDALRAKLVTPPVRYSKPELQAHIQYLYGLTTQADQTIGRDAVERYRVLRAELDQRQAEARRLLGARTVSLRWGDAESGSRLGSQKDELGGRAGQ